MSSERRKGYRKLSRGILKSRVHDSEDDRRENHGVKIFIKPNDNNDTLPLEDRRSLSKFDGEPMAYPSTQVDEERFEQLKALYYKQCQPINMNLIRKLTDKRTTSDYNTYSRSHGVEPSPQSSTSTIYAERLENPSHSRHDIAKRTTHESRNPRKEPQSRREYLNYRRH